MGWGWIPWPFALASCWSILYALLNVLNLWTRKVPVHRPVAPG